MLTYMRQLRAVWNMSHVLQNRARWGQHNKLDNLLVIIPSRKVPKNKCFQMFLTYMYVHTFIFIF